MQALRSNARSSTHAMRLILIAVSCLTLSGCWFIWIPMGIFAKGNFCVTERHAVGQKVLNQQTGKNGVITELHGRSERCQRGEIPILATVEYD